MENLLDMKAFAKGGPIPVQNISLPFFIFFGAIGAISVPFLAPISYNMGERWKIYAEKFDCRMHRL